MTRCLVRYYESIVGVLGMGKKATVRQFKPRKEGRMAGVQCGAEQGTVERAKSRDDGMK